MVNKEDKPVPIRDAHHYSVEAWVDFARGVPSEQQRIQMQAHLDQGCESCAEELKFWRQIHLLAMGSRHNEPPERVLQAAKHISIGGRRSIAKAGPSTVDVRLLFDSTTMFLTSGVRSSSPRERQLLYEVGDYQIDVRIDPKRDLGQLDLTGQILNALTCDRPPKDIPVRAIRGRKILAETITNEFGEFHFAGDFFQGFRLCLELGPYEKLSLPWIRP